MSAAIYAGVELGGTKCVCTLGTNPHDIREQQVIPTRDPAVTLAAIADILTRWHAQVAPLSAIGIASFGPLELRRESPDYGRLGATTKQYWDYCDLVGFFARRFSVPIGVTTDVIGAALAEGRWGDARGLSHFAYVTVGTGVGVGVVVGGKPLSGCHHPELGHVRAVRLPGDDWPGMCGFHGACVEGLASGPAIAARTGTNAAELSGDNPVWDTVTHALAQLLHILVMSVGPQRILIGGGVMNTRPELFPKIRQSLVMSLNGFIDIPEIRTGLDTFVVPPGLGTLAGPCGALAVAADMHAQHLATRARAPGAAAMTS
jgi:fructokinase